MSEPTCGQCGSPAQAGRITRCFRCGAMVNGIERQARPAPGKPGLFDAG